VESALVRVLKLPMVNILRSMLLNLVCLFKSIRLVHGLSRYLMLDLLVIAEFVSRLRPTEIDLYICFRFPSESHTELTGVALGEIKVIAVVVNFKILRAHHCSEFICLFKRHITCVLRRNCKLRPGMRCVKVDGRVAPFDVIMHLNCPLLRSKFIIAFRFSCTSFHQHTLRIGLHLFL
jgi:hypothetical protein